MKRYVILQNWPHAQTAEIVKDKEGYNQVFISDEAARDFAVTHNIKNPLIIPL